MFVQSCNQVVNRSGFAPSGSNRLLHRAVVTSTSLLAMSAALGWSNPALAVGTCGAPVGGVANCSLTSYPTGIEYFGPDAVDDLTVNVGTFAGQTGAVTVTGGIVVIGTTLPAADNFENLYVGSNVTITAAGSGEAIQASSTGNLASEYVVSGAGITAAGGDGISTGSIDLYAAPPATTYSSSAALSTIVNSGTIGAYAYGVGGFAEAETLFGYSAAAYANSTVINSGSVSTTGSTGGYGSIGVASFATANSYGGYSTATATSSIVNSGDVKTSGTNADGIGALAKADAESYYFGYANAIAAAAATNTGSVQTGGLASFGMGAEAIALAGITTFPVYSTASASAAAYNFGSVTTKGAGATGLLGEATAESYGLINTEATANANVVNAGTVTTTGDGAAGIVASATGVAQSYFGATGAAYATVVNSGSISTGGAGAAGMRVTATSVAYSFGNSYAYSVATAKNAGTINTSGVGSAGMVVEAEGEAVGYFASVYASALAVNTGSIATTSDDSVGIYALGGDSVVGALTGPYANATVVNTGDVTTKGMNSLGIVAISSTYSGGGYVYSAARSTVTNGGAISTSKDGSVGIYALSTSDAASLATIAGDKDGKTYAGSSVTNAGTVETAGLGAAGTVAVSRAGSYAYQDARAQAVSSVTNVGLIATAGQGGEGIVSQSQAIAFSYFSSTYESSAKASSTVLNAGVVNVTGAGTFGIVAESVATAIGSASDATATATTSVTNAGSVTSASGIGVEAVSIAYAYSATNPSVSATTLVINAGSIAANGAGGVGVFSAAQAGTNLGQAPGSSTVVNAAGATISASGAGGVGVNAEGAYSTVLTYSGSSIAGGTGVGASGVYTNGAEGVVANGGSIGSGNDAAIVMTGVYANIIQNTGTITGFVTLHGTGPTSQNVFYNYGTWVARGGNSDFTHGAAGGSNLVDEATGKIVVVGNQSFTNLDKFTNLGGLVTMTQAATFGLGTRPAFETLTISGDYEGIAGKLAVDASTVGGTMQGDVFQIDGAASGITDVRATILGAPGLTTGNGILLVQANATTGASDFMLAGNANGGHSLVDGAFEYNLAFVPGGGTAGDWYLQSTIYPGVYQFGQIGSSTILISDSVNPSVDDLLNQAFNGSVQDASLDNLSQQVASTDNSFVPAPNGPGVSGWGRFDESRFNVDPSGSSLADYKLRVDSVQVGIDYDWHNATNNVIVGGYATPFHAWSDFSAFGGHIGTSGMAYGAYGLWFSGPWQAGLRLNYDDNTAHISDTFIGTSASTKPTEKGIQGAASYDMPLDWADFTPSAEINYGTVSGVQFTDGAGDLVKVGTTNDFWGKLNGRFSWDVTTAHGLLVQPYFNIGLLYRGDSDTKVTVGGFPTSTNIDGYNGDFAVGVNTNLAAGLSLSAQADYVAGNRVEGWTGFIGLRYTPGAVEAPQPAPPSPPPPPPPPPPTKTFIVFFDFNKSNLTAEAQSVVAEAVKTAKENGMVRVLVTGHTDTVGSDSYNMGLSVRRAQSVKDEMVREGMDGSGISIEGKGFHDPLVPTGPGVREPQNRRAVIDLGG